MTDGRRVKNAVLAVVAIGSNVGDPVRYVRQAIAKLRGFSASPLKASSLWQSTPVDCPPGSPPFVNAVVSFTPHAQETPETLLRKLQSLEKEFGRRPKQVLNEPRPLDLDLIAFGQEKRATDKLALPHPRAHRRRFVLQPLAEIAPELLLPGQTETTMQLLLRLPPDPGMERLSDT